MLLLFFHTLCQTWSHSTRLQTTESHTHVSFPQKRTNTDAARVGRRQEALWKPSLALNSGSCPEADTSLSSPCWPNFPYFFFGKSKFVEPQKLCVPWRFVFRAAHMNPLRPSGPCCSVETHSLSFPLTFCPLAKIKAHLGKSLAYFCLVRDIFQLGLNKCH